MMSILVLIIKKVVIVITFSNTFEIQSNERMFFQFQRTKETAFFCMLDDYHSFVLLLLYACYCLLVSAYKKYIR